jgi:hypothetical protein
MRTRSLWIATVIAAAALAGTSAQAGSFDLYGSHWNTDEADQSFGGGVTWASGSRAPLALELRAGYYEELSNEPLDNLFDDDPVFEEGVQAIPVEAGLRVRFNGPEAAVRPYVAGGAGYYLLDSDFGEVDDEFGWYAAAGSSFGNGTGAEFFAEVDYRKIEGTVEVDPESLGDVDDIEFEDEVELDLSGIGVNMGISWRW